MGIQYCGPTKKLDDEPDRENGCLWMVYLLLYLNNQKSGRTFDTLNSSGQQ